MSKWAETGLICCPHAAFTVAHILPAMSVVVGVYLGTMLLQKFSLLSSSPQRGSVQPAAYLDGVPQDFCKPQELPLFALHNVLGHV